jgi:hypothetical protein
MVQRLRPAAIILLAIMAITAGLLWLTLTPAPVRINVRWTTALDDAERANLETRFHLTDGARTTGTTFTYVLADRSADNIRALVQNPAAEDTDGINRTRFRPFNAFQHEKRIGVLAIVTGTIAAFGWLLAPLIGSRARRAWVPSSRAVLLTMSVPPVLLVVCSAAMLVSALVGFDPLWLSSRTNPDASGTTSLARVEDGDDACVRPMSTGAIPLETSRASETGADACASGLRTTQSRVPTR